MLLADINPDLARDKQTVFIPGEYAGPCFIGFAIGESLGASALRIAGGIFTKIADIGSDLMKIVFNIKEDDARNPGVIADCTGDNAGDSVGPTADGFETYGVTGVALITFVLVALSQIPGLQVILLVWIFAMRIAMIVASIGSYLINEALAKRKPSGERAIPRTGPVWVLSVRKLRPVAISQNRMVLSSPALMSTLPSGETARARTQPLCPRTTRSSFIVGMSKKRIVLSRLPVIRILPSGVNVMAPIQNSIGFWNPPSSSMKKPRVSVESSAVSSQ